MPVSGGGFEQCYNAQAGVDANTMLVVATTLTQAPNDKQQVQPILDALQAQAAKLGAATTLIADTGYCSENNVKVCEEAKLVPLIAVARQDHCPHWSERFTEPPALKADATPMEAMTHRLTTLAGRATYAIRKQTVEPVFGIIKSVMGFRQFSLRGLRKVTGEWNLVCLAWNVKRMAVLRPKVG
jgi:IS5 family transposase